MVEMENEIVRLTLENIDFQKKKLEKIAANLNHSVSGFINEKQAKLTKTGNELRQNIGRFSYQKAHELNTLKHHLESTVLLKFAVTKTLLSQKRKTLKHVVSESLLKKNTEISRYKQLLAVQSGIMIFREQERIHFNENTARLVNPENILKRGYSITLVEGKIVKSVNQLNISEEIETRISDGKVKSKIVKKENYEH
jgi:exodeoxyribonuclease VII large subunit